MKCGAGREGDTDLHVLGLGQGGSDALEERCDDLLVRDRLVTDGQPFLEEELNLRLASAFPESLLPRTQMDTVRRTCSCMPAGLALPGIGTPMAGSLGAAAGPTAGTAGGGEAAYAAGVMRGDGMGGDEARSSGGGFAGGEIEAGGGEAVPTTAASGFGGGEAIRSLLKSS